MVLKWLSKRRDVPLLLVALTDAAAAHKFENTHAGRQRQRQRLRERERVFLLGESRNWKASASRGFKMFSAKGRSVWWGRLRLSFSNNSCMVIMVK